MAASLKNMNSTSSAFLGRQPARGLTPANCVTVCFCHQELPSQRAVMEEAPGRLLPQGPGSSNKEAPWKEVSWSLTLLKPLLRYAPRGTWGPLVLRQAFSLLLGYVHHWQLLLYCLFTTPTHVPYWFICPQTPGTAEIDFCHPPSSKGHRCLLTW